MIDFEAEGRQFENRWAEERKRLPDAIERKIPTDHGKGVWRAAQEDSPALLDDLAEIAAGYACGRLGSSRRLGLGWPQEAPQRGDQNAKDSLESIAKVLRRAEEGLEHFETQPWVHLLRNPAGMIFGPAASDEEQYAYPAGMTYHRLLRDLSAVRARAEKLAALAAAKGISGKRDERAVADRVEEAIRTHAPRNMRTLYSSILKVILNRSRVGRNATRRKNGKA